MEEFDGGSVEDDGGDVDALAYMSQVFSSPPKDGVVLWKVRRCGGSPPGRLWMDGEAWRELGLPLLI